MTAWDYAIAHVVKALIIATLAGIVLRRRDRKCRAFVAYLLVVLVCNSLVTSWPEHFFVFSFWTLQQGAYDLAKLAVALEIARRAFGAFPGARATGRVAVFVVLALTTAAIIPVPTGASLDRATFSQIVMEWHPRILSGTIWLFTATALLVAWYRIPLHAFQRSILAGFTAYLLLFTTLLNVLRTHGWNLLDQVNALDGLAYAAVMAWWCYASWQPDEKLAVSPTVAQRLRLEHA